VSSPTLSKLKPSDFVHLHNHTQYSLLDGLTKVPKLMDYVKEMHMDAVAITDHGTLSGVVEFYKSGKANEIKPIIGIETYVASRKHTDKEPVKDKPRFHLILLAMNKKGYENLMRLSTIANLEGFYYFPRVDHELLEQYNEGIIALSGCMGGEVGNALKNGQYDKALEIAKWYKKIFGDRYYLEVQDHGHKENPKHSAVQSEINTQVLKIGQELDIPAVVTCDAHYLKHEDEDAHEILLCVGTGSFLSDEKRMSLKDFPLFVEDPKEIIKRWGKTHPDLITNTSEIAERCNVELQLGKYLIPSFPVPDDETEESYLFKMTYVGLVNRYNPGNNTDLSLEDLKKLLSKAVVDRAEYELGIIASMGFNGYFLIVQDFINWGKDQGIVFGPGRGSGAGSIIAYALKITELDPLKYDLLFERFLNPDRISMPDFDVDIQDTRRDEVIQYCVSKYGKDRVANIVTFGRMFARNAVRDVSRVLQVPYADADRLAKMIPAPVQGRHIPLEVSLKKNPELKAEYESNEQSKKVLDLAVQLEGTVRSHGVHAAGVVIAPDEIVKFTPLEMAQKGVVSTQYSGVHVEELGLVKMDFLGLSNLTIIKNTLRIVKKVYKTELDIETLPLDDEKTFELLRAGDTTGVFQLESAGMKRYLRDLKPTEFDDIIAMCALYRPGPLTAGLTDAFVARKNGREPVTVAHEKFKDALGSTFGVLVYQEQVMKISKDVCGFTGGEADTLRKAIGKKKLDVMQKMQAQFIEGGVKHGGVDKEIMEKFWEDLMGFADYAFNKSHSACYGLIAYQTAYLKAHYPDAFMAALMTSDFDNIDRLAIEITECRNMGLEVLAPDVNQSFQEFAVVPGKKQIRFGLHAIKNVGSNAVDEIVNVRTKKKTFKDIEDFFSNVSPRIVNRKSIESLIKSGAFDSFGDRIQILDNIDVLLGYASKINKERELGQTDLFGGSGATAGAKPSLKLGPAVSTELTQNDQLQWERELLGLYVSQHPLEQYREFLQEMSVSINQLTKEHDGKTVTVGGAIGEVREITTKTGKKMAFAKLADELSEIELIVFPRTYEENPELWIRDKVILIKAKIDATDRNGDVTDEVKLIVNSAKAITDVALTHFEKKGKTTKIPTTKPKVNANTNKDRPPERIYIRLDSSKDESALNNIKKVLDSTPGKTEVVLVIGNDKQAVRLPQSVDSKVAIKAFQSLFGDDHVRLH
jgi:DNA polymerase-3 subunit alpha